MHDAAHMLDERFHLLLEVGMQVGLHTADHVVVLDEASAGGLLEDVEHHLTFAEAVEERGEATHVKHQTGEVEQVGVDTLQLVHDGTDVLRTLGNLDAGSLLDAHAQGMAALVCAQVVQTVGQGECLRVGEALVHLLDAAVDVSADRVYTLHRLTVEGDTHTQCSVG